jgi:hypothetical protein
MDSGMNVWLLEFLFWTWCLKTLLEDGCGEYRCLMTFIFLVFGKLLLCMQGRLEVVKIWNLGDNNETWRLEN